MTKKVLLTGASGVLGWNFCKKMLNDYELVGTFFRNQPTDVNIEWKRINLLETTQIPALIEETKPDVVVHLAAIANAKFCEQHPALSHHINVYTSVALAEATKGAGIPMIFSSTDLVFNGNSAPYQEDDFCYPLSQYGMQKQTAEELLLNDFEHVFVARFPLLFGPSPEYATNFYTLTIDKLKEGEEIYVFTDEYRSMISTEIASEWLQKLINYSLDDTIPENKKERLLHVGGKESCSRYDFTLKLAAKLGLNEALIIATQQKELELIPPRPSNVSLDSSLANDTLLYIAPSLDEQLAQL
ncbi:SDR family oxidoreductase [Aureispira anguillae]|uniref:NAD(P)-dependent oxidoreductase n=1 Tax=Aureispira anguillae TaxID=2864201 RepID=A0A915YGP6_9BACT|nr:NAD(P)-dependent oxidoreductase [Aureispira anguillae]BDS12845.1 NAD(P)-dependent oxidoreductase [Aureispira anguillae]